jgi:hypothetical protein
MALKLCMCLLTIMIPTCKQEEVTLSSSLTELCPFFDLEFTLVIPQIFSKFIDIRLWNMLKFYALLWEHNRPLSKAYNCNMDLKKNFTFFFTEKILPFNQGFFYYKALRIVERCCPTDSSCFVNTLAVKFLPQSLSNFVRMLVYVIA